MNQTYNSEEERLEVIHNAVCVEQDCGNPFTVTRGEWDFISGIAAKQRGKPAFPTRCKNCRAKRKAMRNNGSLPARPAYNRDASDRDNYQGHDQGNYKKRNRNQDEFNENY